MISIEDGKVHSTDRHRRQLSSDPHVVYEVTLAPDTEEAGITTRNYCPMGMVEGIGGSPPWQQVLISLSLVYEPRISFHSLESGETYW